MSAQLDHHVAIAGAGIAGLALASALGRSRILDGQRLLLVDQRQGEGDDRTLSYFSAVPRPVDALARATFSKLRFIAPGLSLDLPLATYRYHSVRGRDYRRQARAELAARAGVTLVEGRVDALEDRGSHAAVIVDGTPHLTRWAFDARGPAALTPPAGRHDTLVQRFVGWEIALDRPALDPSAAVLFHLPDQGDRPADFRFNYVVPFGPRRALVELVTFGAPAPEPDLDRYLAEIVPGVHFRVLRQERGESLLTTAASRARRRRAAVVPIGVAGGLLKPSTGYAFTRILDDAEAITAALEAGRHPLATARRRSLYRLLDAAFLRVAAARPGRLAGIFTALFRRNPVERVLRLLDERARLRDVLALMWSMPRWLFVRAFATSAAVRLGLLPAVRQRRWIDGQRAGREARP